LPDSSALPCSLGEWLGLLEFRHHKAIDLGLERCREVWLRMDSPSPAERIFVVAGTNGKGSTVATICGLLEGLGYRYGCYTTPHIHSYNERIQVSGQVVSDAMLIDAFERVEAARGEVSLSYFEFGTLAAFLILADSGLDFAVMEVGLGGRLDAVNLLDADCAVITPVGLDHQEYLGNDLYSIGTEKAGIIRPGRPLVCGEAEPPASILEIAARNGAPVVRLEKDFSARTCGDHSCFRMGGLELELPLPVLRGAHQLNNAATGLAAVLQLIPEAATRPGALSRGLASVELRGRFDRVHDDPDVWIDVGHNPMGAKVIAQALRARGAGSGRKIRCVLAMLADKDAEAVAAELSAVISSWYCAGLLGDRGQSGQRLAQRVASVIGTETVKVFERVHEALQSALDESEPGDGVLVFGSFHTADEAGSMMVNLHNGAGATG
jgi:dihydrofolate synthase/folylpolyglutamate synthase